MLITWPVIPASSAEDGVGPRDPDHIPHLDVMSSNLTTNFPLSILPHNRALCVKTTPSPTRSHTKPEKGRIKNEKETTVRLLT